MKTFLLKSVKYLLSTVASFALLSVILYALFLPFKDLITIAANALFNQQSDYVISSESALSDKKQEIISEIEAEKQYWADKGYYSKVSIEEMQFPEYKQKYGKIMCERLGINADLYMGDTNEILRHGAGTYFGGHIPGDQGTIMVCAHCHTHFRTLEKTKVGDVFEIETNYGDYVYRVTQTKIIPATDTTSYDFSLDYENLLIYTCYPLNTLKARTERFLVYCELVSGTLIDRGESWK